MSKRKIFTLTAASLFILAFAGLVFVYRQDIRDAKARFSRGRIPTAVTRNDIIRIENTAPETNAVVKKIEPAQPLTPSPSKALPKEMNLRVPFVLQAPFKIWDEIHEDACEEASVLMLQAYVKGEKSLTLDEMDARILGMVDFQIANYGDYKSTDVEATAKIMRDHLKLERVVVLPIATANDIRTQIAKGRPVVIPAAGRLLFNPNFRHGGPLYHMLVVKGYTADGNFVTNDPGTRLGADYIYAEDVLMNAIHDYNGGDVLNGKKMMIVIAE